MKKTEQMKCEECGKKLGYMDFTCKCGKNFCNKHRYPEDHTCSFNFKLSEKEKLKNLLPNCQPKKITTI